MKQATNIEASECRLLAIWKLDWGVCVCEVERETSIFFVVNPTFTGYDISHYSCQFHTSKFKKPLQTTCHQNVLAAIFPFVGSFHSLSSSCGLDESTLKLISFKQEIKDGNLTEAFLKYSAMLRHCKTALSHFVSVCSHPCRASFTKRKH